MGKPKIMQIGSYSPSSQCNAKVLDPEGICPTLLDHKGAEPAILTPIRTEEQRQLRKQGIDTFGGRQMLPRTDGVSNTITTVQKDNLLQEPVSCALRGRGDDNEQRLELCCEVANCLTSVQKDSLVAEPSIIGYTRYRIRKLTPRECFRLMGVDDADIDKIDAYSVKAVLKSGTVKEKPIPKGAKYKLAGNSIVVDVLYHIFHQMFIAEPPKPIQKSLFDL